MLDPAIKSHTRTHTNTHTEINQKIKLEVYKYIYISESFGATVHLTWSSAQEVI